MISIILLAFFAVTAAAQDNFKFEFDATAGYTASEDIDVDEVQICSVTVHRIKPLSGVSRGMNFDYPFDENTGVRFLYNQQHSRLEGDLVGGGKLSLVPMMVHNYRGVFTYNFLSDDSPIRLFRILRCA